MSTNADPEAGIPPRPWSVWKEPDRGRMSASEPEFNCWGILDADGQEVVITDAGYYPPNLETAEFICKCVNVFEKLQTVVGHVAGINDERDSVPLLLAVRDLVKE